MRIAIIIEKNLDGQKGGIEVYTYNLIKNLLKIDKKNTFFFIKDHLNNGFPQANEIKINLGKTPARKVLKNSFDLPGIVQRYQLDIVHDPAQMGPFLLPMKAKKILTIYDLFPLTHPQTAPSKYSPYIYKYILPWVLRGTDRIIAGSQNTQKDLLKFFPFLRKKITVIYAAADESFKKISRHFPARNRYAQALAGGRSRHLRGGNPELVEGHDSSEVEKLKSVKSALNFPFIFALGTLSPRKNFETLIRAFSQAKSRGLKHRLIIGGQRGWRFEKIFLEADDLLKKGEIVFPGFIPEKDLPYFYHRADLFVFTSLYEGFGLPVLEAMSCGCPVITSNVSSLPEVGGKAALYINNPLDADELAAKIKKVLGNPNLKEKLIKKGFIQSAKFSWQKTAKETIRVYEEIHKSK